MSKSQSSIWSGTYTPTGERITFKQYDAETRRTARGKRSDAEQLAELDRRLGVGVGAVRERARLGGA